MLSTMLVFHIIATVINSKGEGKGHPFSAGVIRKSDTATVMLLDKAFGDCKTQAGSMSLGGKKRFEHVPH